MERLIEAWASIKRFGPKDQGGTDQGKDPPPPSAGGRNVEVDFRGQTRSNETHESITDRDDRLYCKGPGMACKRRFIRHTLMENRSGLIVDTRLMSANGHAERFAALSIRGLVDDRAEG